MLVYSLLDDNLTNIRMNWLTMESGKDLCRWMKPVETVLPPLRLSPRWLRLSSFGCFNSSTAKTCDVFTAWLADPDPDPGWFQRKSTNGEFRSGFQQGMTTVRVILPLHRDSWVVVLKNTPKAVLARLRMPKTVREGSGSTTMRDGPRFTNAAECDTHHQWSNNLTPTV